MRPTGVRRRLLVQLVLLTGLTLLPTGGPASASCAGPAVEVPASLTIGVRTEVTGTGFVVGCRDSMDCGIGCGDCEYADPPPVPATGVPLQLRQDGVRWRLAFADADSRGRVTWSFTLPDGVRPGRAQLIWDGDPRGAPVQVTAR